METLLRMFLITRRRLARLCGQFSASVPRDQTRVYRLMYENAGLTELTGRETRDTGCTPAKRCFAEAWYPSLAIDGLSAGLSIRALRSAQAKGCIQSSSIYGRLRNFKQMQISTKHCMCALSSLSLVMTSFRRVKPESFIYSSSSVINRFNYTAFINPRRTRRQIQYHVTHGA